MKSRKYISRWIVLTSFAVGLALLITSFFLPPQGVVDPSVIKSVGLIFTFASVVEALFTDKIVHFRRGDTDIYIGTPGTEPPQYTGYYHTTGYSQTYMQDPYSQYYRQDLPPDPNTTTAATDNLDTLDNLPGR